MMFEMRRERHSYSSIRRVDREKWVPEEIWVDAEVLVRKDGLRLICLGKVAGRTGKSFRYVKHVVAFDFWADRCHEGGTVTGTYIVTADLRYGQKLGGNAWPIERLEIEAIATDIDLGLRAWPIPQADVSIPIGAVHFDFRSPPSREYRLALGTPLALRDAPASTRWLTHTVRHRVAGGLYGPYTYLECPSLVRDDGVQLVRIPTMERLRGGSDDYNYVKPDVSFFFEAERHLGSIVTDTWEVRLDPPYRDGFSPAKRDKLGAAKCAQVVRNIEEALYAWTPERYETEEEKVPVNRVVFLDPP